MSQVNPPIDSRPGRKRRSSQIPTAGSASPPGRPYPLQPQSGSQSPQAQSANIAGNRQSAYGQLIRDQLAEERKTKDSLEQRGWQVVQTSTALGTLLFGATALGTQPERLSSAVKLAIGMALALFVVGVAMALKVVQPRAYNEMTDAALDSAVSVERWGDSSEQAERTAVTTLVDIIKQHRQGNLAKANWLGWSVRAQSCALVAILVAVAVLLLRI